MADTRETHLSTHHQTVRRCACAPLARICRTSSPLPAARFSPNSLACHACICVEISMRRLVRQRPNAGRARSRGRQISSTPSRVTVWRSPCPGHICQPEVWSASTRPRISSRAGPARPIDMTAAIHLRFRTESGARLRLGCKFADHRLIISSITMDRRPVDDRRRTIGLLHHLEISWKVFATSFLAQLANASHPLLMLLIRYSTLVIRYSTLASSRTRSVACQDISRACTTPHCDLPT